MIRPPRTPLRLLLPLALLCASGAAQAQMTASDAYSRFQVAQIISDTQEQVDSMVIKDDDPDDGKVVDKILHLSTATVAKAQTLDEIEVLMAMLLAYDAPRKAETAPSRGSGVQLSAGNGGLSPDSTDRDAAQKRRMNPFGDPTTGGRGGVMDAPPSPASYVLRGVQQLGGCSGPVADILHRFARTPSDPMQVSDISPRVREVAAKAVRDLGATIMPPDYHCLDRAGR